MAFCHVRTSNSKAIQKSTTAALYQGIIHVSRDKHKTSYSSTVLC